MSPLYDFSCPKCDHKWDEFASMYKDEFFCPKCGERAKRHIGTMGYRYDHTIRR